MSGAAGTVATCFRVIAALAIACERRRVILAGAIDANIAAVANDILTDAAFAELTLGAGIDASAALAGLTGLANGPTGAAVLVIWSRQVHTVNAYTVDVTACLTSRTARFSPTYPFFSTVPKGTNIWLWAGFRIAWKWLAKTGAITRFRISVAKLSVPAFRVAATGGTCDSTDFATEDPFGVLGLARAFRTRLRSRRLVEMGNRSTP